MFEDWDQIRGLSEQKIWIIKTELQLFLLLFSSYHYIFGYKFFPLFFVLRLTSTAQNRKLIIN